MPKSNLKTPKKRSKAPDSKKSAPGFCFQTLSPKELLKGGPGEDSGSKFETYPNIYAMGLSMLEEHSNCNDGSYMITSITLEERDTKKIRTYDFDGKRDVLPSSGKYMVSITVEKLPTDIEADLEKYATKISPKRKSSSKIDLVELYRKHVQNDSG